MAVNSPLKLSRQPPAENLLSKVQHKISGAIIDATRMGNYVDSVLDQLANSKISPETPILDAISADANVKATHKALLRVPATLEKNLYGSMVQLLNYISAAYYVHGLREGDAVIFTLRPDSPPGGDYLALKVKPDVCGYRGLFEELLLAVEHTRFMSLQPWSALLEVGELKRLLNALPVGGQLKTYLTSLKRYRPDMTIVHGFSLERGHVKLASLNPCGMTESDPIPWDDLSPWIAHVVQVYESLHKRDVDMDYCMAQQQFHRWDIRKSGVGLAVTPFHIGTAPGRTTFACFEVGRVPENEPGTDAAFLAELDANFNTGIVEGFWKLSWQRTTSRSTEKELLDLLHKDGWVPGLVRHHPETSVRGPDATAVFHPSGKQTPGLGRVRDILHLGSIGQPLSQCETVGDMLDVMYDLLEVHAHVCELGVLHRDVSYFNVMCKPQHYITTHPVLGTNRVLERPCIKKVFGDENGEPCVLLTDLDHATTFTELETGAVDVTKTVGTPMFVSVYLAAHSARRKFNYKPLGGLLEVLEAAETTQPAHFKRAFPNGDGDFIEKFKQVVAAEQIRGLKKASVTVVPETRHDWRHDAESIYWVFLYSFARALPHGAVSEETGTFKLLCEAMLKHSTDALSGLSAREVWVKADVHDDLFAPALKLLETLFEHMADYWTIPWHLYCGEGGIMAGNRNHVHVAFRRLIIWFKLDIENAEALLVRLSTSAPRITSVLDNLVRETVTPSIKRAATGIVTTIETRFSTGQKRKAEILAASLLDNDTRDCKRSKPSGLSSVATTSDDALFAANDMDTAPQAELEALQERPKTDDAAKTDKAVDEENRQPKDKPAEPYDAAVHCHAKSAKALRTMFWKDRALWFGRGT